MPGFRPHLRAKRRRGATLALTWEGTRDCGDTSRPGEQGVENDDYFFWVGTGMPGIFTLTEPRWVRLVKYRVFQSSPPKPRLVVAGAPCTIRPSFLPRGSTIHNPPAPP